MPRLWGWFSDHRTFVAFVKAHTAHAQISIWVRPPGKSPDEIMVVGPQSQDVAPYPFLDACHHMRRLGIDGRQAERYTEILRQGAPLVCLEGEISQLSRDFPGYDAVICE